MMEDKEFLYYYTNAETLLKILPERKIKLSELSHSSDLRERTFYKAIENPYKGIDVTDANCEANRNRYVCFCSEPNKTEWTYKDKGCKLPNMWDTYGDRHRGACIVIDKAAFKRKNSDLQEVLIEYSEDVAGASYGDDILEEMKKKHTDYSLEHEVRFISTTGKDKCDIDGCIRKVILGIDFKNAHVLERTEDTHKNLLFLKLRDKEINLDPTLFTIPIIDNSSLLISENGGILWKEMKDFGIEF